MKEKRMKRILLAAVVLGSLVFLLTGCEAMTNLFQGDIEIAGTWVDDGGYTWTIDKKTLSVDDPSGTDWDYSGTIVYYRNEDLYLVFQITEPMTGYTCDDNKYVKIFWKAPDDTDADDVVWKIGGVTRTTADTDGSYYWASQTDAEAAVVGDVGWWSNLTASE